MRRLTVTGLAAAVADAESAPAATTAASAVERVVIPSIEPPLSTRAYGLAAGGRVSWLPGLPCRAFPGLTTPVAAFVRAVGFPGHSGGAAPAARPRSVPAPPRDGA